MTEISPVVRTVQATRYVTPLREGGSLPAIVEADDLGTYVLKFRGAELGDESRSAAAAGLVPNGALIVMPRRRRPVR